MKLVETKVAERRNRLDEFKEGQLGVIRSWWTHPFYTGRLVFLENDILYCLSSVYNGDDRSASWIDFSGLCLLDGDFYIETLEPGTKIEVIV